MTAQRSTGEAKAPVAQTSASWHNKQNFIKYKLLPHKPARRFKSKANQIWIGLFQ